MNPKFNMKREDWGTLDETQQKVLYVISMMCALEKAGLLRNFSFGYSLGYGLEDIHEDMEDAGFRISPEEALYISRTIMEDLRRERSLQ